MTFLPLINRRAFRHWQLVLDLMLGVILVTGLLASGSMLVEAVLDFAILYKLRAADSLDRDTRHTTYENLTTQEYQSLDSQVRARIENNIGGYTASHNANIIEVADSFFDLKDGRLVPADPGSRTPVTEKVEFMKSVPIQADYNEEMPVELHNKEIIIPSSQ
jgi:hypothetical protein